MKSQILNLGKVLSKNDQKEIQGGFWGCIPEKRECKSHNDCPPCSLGCGITINNNGTPFVIEGICAY